MNAWESMEIHDNPRQSADLAEIAKSNGKCWKYREAVNLLQVMFELMGLAMYKVLIELQQSSSA